MKKVKTVRHTIASAHKRVSAKRSSKSPIHDPVQKPRDEHKKRETAIGIGVGLILTLCACLGLLYGLRDRQVAFEFKINRWNYNDGSETFQAGADEQFVVVDVSIVHHLTHAAWFAPVLQSYIIDNHGHEYALSPLESKQPFEAGEYLPNHWVTGTLTYRVPKQSQDLRWCYRFDAVSMEPMCRPLVRR